jgi:LysR family nitrogen assimilation transcriptional regulator
VLYREASAILRQVEQLPGVVRSSSGETEGAVSLGISSTLAAAMAGPFIESCKAALPKVTLKFTAADSLSMKARIEAHTLDMALVFEDELIPTFSRRPLFRQRLYLIRRRSFVTREASISLERLVSLPLILPSHPNVLRSLLDRTFAAAGVLPNMVAEADVLSSMLSAVQSEIGHTIIPKGDLSDIAGNDMPRPLLIEPPLYLTASIITSSDFPLTYAGEAVRDVLTRFVESHQRAVDAPGCEWIG